MIELEIKSRQTLSTWEGAEEVPRVVELAIIALDQVAPARKRSGFERQFTPQSIASRHVAEGTKYFASTKGDIAKGAEAFGQPKERLMAVKP
jgi:hypothetical protein